MNNAINRINTLLVKFFSIIFVAGLLASCASVTDSGFEDTETKEKTTVNTDVPEVNPTSTDDEMDPIITDGPGTGGR
ncbi:hypothetical protein [Fodinibius sediminis]|uniref:Uncharacterized protein n=1 Tax=Fodinibius sediminis TaxID=1214077 RepID=A0A521DBE9_9BACT|nr:hypothetical protein [Fodinibius sediminis]SMO68996.1 hypothetical protein SAMN06265218_109131 [Fodinibius sediminis]